MKTEVMDTFDFSAQSRYFKDAGLDLDVRVASRSARKFTASSNSKTGNSAGDVIGDAVVVYDPILTPKQREIVADSLLFAEMRADEECGQNRDNNEKWFREYGRALKACGWYQPDFTFTDFKSSTTKLTVNKAVLEILQTIAGPNPAKLLGMMSVAFNTLKDDEKGLKLVESKSQKNKAGTFKGIPCTLDGGQLAVLMACLHLESKDFMVNGFWGEYESKDLRVYRAAGKRYINENAFERVWDRVRGYIGIDQDNYFKPIEKR